MFDFVPSAWVAEFSASSASSASSSAESPQLDTGQGYCHYVCTSEGNRIVLLAGPFRSAEEAEGWTHVTRYVLAERDQRLVELAVTRVIGQASTGRPGDLNDLLGVPSPRRS